MGTFAHYYFPGHMSPEKKDEYVKRALTVLQKGGLMGVERLPSSSGEWLELLKPWQMINGGYDFEYSYFERTHWEDAFLNPETGKFVTEKVGYSIFGQVCYAVHLLRELYDDIPGVAVLSGTAPQVEVCLRWFNYLFDEEWEDCSDSRLYRIQELYRQYPDWLDGPYGKERHPTQEEYEACVTALDPEALALDPELLGKLAHDGICSEGWSADLAEMLKQIPTRLMLNIASVQSRGFGLEPEKRLISPDDMAFWWEPDCLETFSQDMEEWLKSLQEKFRSCLQAPEEIAVRRALMQILEKGQDGFGSMHPFLFSEVFWDYIDHQSDPHVMAATRLLETIMDNALRDKDRTKLDRYCAVLANRKLREKVLGF